MIKNSRFAKVAVSAGLIVASGAAVLGLTSFASAKVAGNHAASAPAGYSAFPADSSVLTVSNDGGVIATAEPGVTDDATKPARPNPLAVAAKALGISEADLVAELKAGKSIADVAKEKDVDIDTVVAALTADFKAHLDEEVKSGEHTQAEADAKLAEFTTRVTTMVNTKGLPPMRGGHGARDGMGHGPRFVSDNLAKVLKLTTDELNTQLRSGKSLADIAKAQDVSISDVKDVLTADFKAHLDEEVKSGEHTQAEADAKLAEFTTRLDDMVNGVRPAGGPMMGGHGGRDGDGRGHGMRGHGGHDDGMPIPAQPGDDTSAEGASSPA